MRLLKQVENFILCYSVDYGILGASFPPYMHSETENHDPQEEIVHNEVVQHPALGTQFSSGSKLLIHVNELAHNFLSSVDADSGAKSTATSHVSSMKDAETFEVDKVDVQSCHDEERCVGDGLGKRMSAQNFRQCAVYLSNFFI
jgi:hypothetical protein